MMSDRDRLWMWLAIGLAAIVVFAAPVVAQEAPPVEPDEILDEEQAEEPTEEELIAMAREPFGGEITVTARRREEALQEIPIAVSVVTGENLEDITATDIAEMQQFVPNLSIYSGRNQSSTLTAFVRGIGQADPLWGVDPGVGLYIDDVYIARAQGSLLDVYDVARVEVLRGPQGTLYGKNTIGGAIKYVTKPLSDTPEGRVTWNPGNYNTQEFRASIGGPIVEGKLRAKASFAWLTRDGYGENVFQGRDVSNKDTKAYRLGLEWLPSDNLRVRFDYDRVEDDAEPKGYKRLEANFFCPLFLGAPCPPLDDNFDTESGLAPLNSYVGNGYSMTWTWDINPDWQFKSITAYRESDTENNIDFDTTPARIVDTSALYYDDQTSQEFQLVFDGGGRWSGVMGFYYFSGSAGGDVNAVFVESTFSVTEGYVDTESFALYGDANYQISDRWTLNFGLRPTREKKTGDVFNGLATDDTFETIAVVSADFVDSTTFNSLAPKIGVDYRASENVMIYGKINQGFKSGGYNVRAQSNFFPDSALPFDDETLTMGEIGVKSTLANNQVVLNVAGFYGNYDDVQVSTFTDYDSDGDGTNDAFFGNFLNAGNATVQGVEVEYAYNSPSFFGLSGFLAYLDASPDEFLDENGDGFVDTQVITNAPEWTGTIRANFDWPLFGGLLTASVGYAYRTESVLTNEGGPDPRDPTGETPLEPLIQDDYGTLDAWVSWLSGNAKWRVGISGKNLTDEEFLTNGYNLPSLGVVTGSYGAPLTVVGTLEFRFW
jgi:iron complex outermembrane receptor protein